MTTEPIVFEIDRDPRDVYRVTGTVGVKSKRPFVAHVVTWRGGIMFASPIIYYFIYRNRSYTPSWTEEREMMERRGWTVEYLETRSPDHNGVFENPQ